MQSKFTIKSQDWSVSIDGSNYLKQLKINTVWKNIWVVTTTIKGNITSNAKLQIQASDILPCFYKQCLLSR